MRVATRATEIRQHAEGEGATTTADNKIGGVERAMPAIHSVFLKRKVLS
jgi:hypothetical protein